MAGTKFSDYLGLKHNKKAKKIKHFIHLRLTNLPQSLCTYHIKVIIEKSRCEVSLMGQDTIENVS
jgi:hypothetical protein